MTGILRTGTGGWTFEPWRGVFYPKGTRQADELAFAARHLTAIEINSTYYSSQKPESFAKWAAATPPGFKFAVKASRFCTNRKVLADAAPTVQNFLNQGIVELGDRLGPILWQFMATKKFDPVDFAAFLDLLPATLGGIPLRHCVEVRHDSFADPAFVALCRTRGVAIGLTDSAEFPMIADVTADFVYARLMRGEDGIDTCYPPDGLQLWERRLKAFAAGEAPDDLTLSDPNHPAPRVARDVFAFFIKSGKVRAPAGAMALQSLADR